MKCLADDTMFDIFEKTGTVERVDGTAVYVRIDGALWILTEAEVETYEQQTYRKRNRRTNRCDSDGREMRKIERKAKGTGKQKNADSKNLTRSKR